MRWNGIHVMFAILPVLCFSAEVRADSLSTPMPGQLHFIRTAAAQAQDGKIGLDRMLPLAFLLQSMRPYAQMLGELPVPSVIRHNARYAYWDGVALRGIDANLISTWLVSHDGKYLITVEDWSKLVQRDFGTFQVVANYGIIEWNYSIARLADAHFFLVYSPVLGQLNVISLVAPQAISIDVGIHEAVRIDSEQRQFLVGQRLYSVDSLSVGSEPDGERLERHLFEQLSSQWSTIDEHPADSEVVPFCFPALVDEAAKWESVPTTCGLDSISRNRDSGKHLDATLNDYRSDEVPCPKIVPTEDRYFEIAESVRRHRLDDAFDMLGSFDKLGDTPTYYIQDAYRYEWIVTGGRAILVAHASAGAQYGHLALTDVTKGQPLRSRGLELHGDAAGPIGLSHDGRLLLISDVNARGHDAFYLLDLEEFEFYSVDTQPAGFGPRQGGWAFSSNSAGLAVATSFGEVWIYAIDSVNRRLQLTQRLQMASSTASCGNSEAGLESPHPAQERVEWPHWSAEFGTLCLVYPDAGILVHGSEHCQVFAIDDKTNDVLWSKDFASQGSTIRAIAAPPTGSVVAVATDECVQLLDAASGLELSMPYRVRIGPEAQLYFLKDNSLVLFDDGFVCKRNPPVVPGDFKALEAALLSALGPP